MSIFMKKSMNQKSDSHEDPVFLISLKNGHYRTYPYNPIIIHEYVMARRDLEF